MVNIKSTSDDKATLVDAQGKKDERVGFSTRLSLAMSDEGIKQVELARRSGESTSTISNYVRGEKLPSAASLIAVSNALNVEPEWLLLGSGNKQQIITIVRPYNIPILNLRLAAGAGVWKTEDLVETKIGMDPLIMQAIGRVETFGLVFVRAQGDSMEPIISEDSLVLIDERDTRLREGIFAFRMGDDLRIKRLRPVGIGDVEAISSNPIYPPEIISFEMREHFEIIGRAIWTGTRL